MNIKGLILKTSRFIESIKVGHTIADKDDNMKGKKTMDRDIFSDLTSTEQHAFIKAGGVIVNAGGNTKKEKPWVRMDRDEFLDMDPDKQAEFIRSGGQIVEAGGNILHRKKAPDRIAREEFAEMDASRQAEFVRSGGKIVD